MSCPDILVLSALSEEEKDAEPWRPHLSTCDVCRTKVELMRVERALLRAAVFTPRPSNDALSRTLAAIDDAAAKEKSGSARPTSSSRTRARSSTPSGRLLERKPRPWLPVLIVAASGIVGAGAVLTLSSKSPEPELPSSPKEDTPRTIATPVKVEVPAPRESEPPREPVRPERTPAPSPEPIVDRTPSVETPAPETPSKPDKPDEPVVADNPDKSKPTPAVVPTSSPSEPPKTLVALATVKSGKLLLASGRSLAAGETLADGDTAEAGASPVVIESEQSASVVLASRSRFSLRAGSKGEPSLTLASGTMLVRGGEKPFVVASADARALASGTFLVSVAPGKTRVSSIDGKVRVEVDQKGVALDMDVRAGFEALVARGKDVEAPLPFAAARSSLAWLPEAQQPKKLPPLVRLAHAISFDGPTSGVTRGSLVRGGAHGSKGCLRGAAGAESSTGVELDVESAGLAVGNSLWVEVTCKVDKASKLELLVDDDKGRAFHSSHELEPGRWTTIAVPFRELQPVHAPKKEDHPARRTLRSVSLVLPRGGETELLVDDVRVFLEE